MHSQTLNGPIDRSKLTVISDKHIRFDRKKFDVISGQTQRRNWKVMFCHFGQVKKQSADGQGHLRPIRTLRDDKFWSFRTNRGVMYGTAILNLCTERCKAIDSTNYSTSSLSLCYLERAVLLLA